MKIELENGVKLKNNQIILEYIASRKDAQQALYIVNKICQILNTDIYTLFWITEYNEFNEKEKMRPKNMEEMKQTFEEWRC
jgi:hypothetical protein